MITDQHIRYARVSQLAQLLKASRPKVSQWAHGRSFNDRSLDEGARVGIPKEVLVAGIEARRRDVALAQQYQEEFEEFLETNFDPEQAKDQSSEL